MFAELRALKLHWPRRFAATMGARGDRLLAALEPHIVDAGRYLKLRRISLARLAAGPGGRYATHAADDAYVRPETSAKP